MRYYRFKEGALSPIDEVFFKRSDNLFVFETFLVRDGSVSFFPEHITRWKYALNLSERNLISFFECWKIFVLNNYRQGCFRVSLFTDSNEFGCSICKFVNWNSELFENGVTVGLEEFSRPNADKKYLTSVYDHYSRKAADRGVEEIVFTDQGIVLEGNITNIFCCDAGGSKVYTPSLGGILPGISRDRFIWNLASEGCVVEERLILVEELEDMAGVFLTNTVRGIIPVREIDGFKTYDIGVSQAFRSWFNNVLQIQEYHLYDLDIQSLVLGL